MTTRSLFSFLLLALVSENLGYGQLTINTFAGNATASFSGDAGPASSSSLNNPPDVSADGVGNLYIADQKNNRIRMVDKNGVISTFAGNGIEAFSGDGGPATAASLNNPTCVYVDPFGSGVYISDTGNQRIRFVNPMGVITTVAGSGVQGYSGDGVPATAAALYNPVRVTEDQSGNLYIADQSNHRVRKVDPATGIITTFAGTGTQSFSGDGGPATSAELNNPTSLAVDSLDNLYIWDQFNHRIREVAYPSGIITTIAGNGTAGFAGDGGLATSAELNFPGGSTIDANGNIFFSDDGNFRVREISGSTGIITTIAGNGTEGFSGDGGPATSAHLDGNFGLTIDSLGNLYIADINNNRVRIVGQASSVAPSFGAGALTNAASFQSGGSAGALVTLFGTHLAVNLDGVVEATQVPLPTTLSNTTLTVNGIAAPLLVVSNSSQFGGQINFQLPWEVAGQSSVSIVVNNGTASSLPFTYLIDAVQPGIFEIFDSGLSANAGAIEHVSGAVVSAANPATPGETVVVFGTGFGPVSPALSTGAPAPGGPLSYTMFSPTITVGGVTASVVFSGQAPYFVGLTQLNVTLSTNTPSGVQPLIVNANGIAGPPVNISIK